MGNRACVRVLGVHLPFVPMVVPVSFPNIAKFWNLPHLFSLFDFPNLTSSCLWPVGWQISIPVIFSRVPCQIQGYSRKDWFKSRCCPRHPGQVRRGYMVTASPTNMNAQGERGQNTTRKHRIYYNFKYCWMLWNRLKQRQVSREQKGMLSYNRWLVKTSL